MSRVFPLLVFLSLLAAPAQPAQAMYMTAKEMHDGCMAESNAAVSSCLGYIAGVIDYHIMMQSLGTAPTIDFCLPDGLSVEQAAVIVLSFLRKAPQNASFIAAPAVVMALNARYPCRAPAPKRKK